MRTGSVTPGNIIGIFVTLLLVGSPVGASGLRDFQDSWLLDGDDSWNLLEETRPLDLVFQGRPTLAVGTGQARLFSLPDLEQVQMSFLARTRVGPRQIQLTGSWQKLGKDLYQETAIRLSFMVGRFPGVGIRHRRTATELAGQEEPAARGLDLVLGHLVWLDRDTLVRGRLAVPLVSNEVEGAFPQRGDFLLLSLMRSRGALTFQVDRRGDGTPILGFEVFWTISEGVGVNLRADPVTGSLGPGVFLRHGMLLLRTSHLVHPDLGQTHRFSLNLAHVHE